MRENGQECSFVERGTCRQRKKLPLSEELALRSND